MLAICMSLICLGEHAWNRYWQLNGFGHALVRCTHGCIQMCRRLHPTSICSQHVEAMYTTVLVLTSRCLRCIRYSSIFLGVRVISNMKSILGGLVVEFGIKKCNFDVLFAAYKWRVQACYIETNVIDFAYTFIYHVSVFGRHYLT